MKTGTAASEIVTNITCLIEALIPCNVVLLLWEGSGVSKGADKSRCYQFSEL